MHMIFVGTMARGAGWSDEAMHALISLWGKANVQVKLDSVAMNQTIYEEIAEGMRRQVTITHGNSAVPRQKTVPRNIARW